MTHKDIIEGRWVSFEECLPKINQKIEILYINNEIREAHLSLSGDNTYPRCIFLTSDDGLSGGFDQISGWRPIDIKRQTFEEI